MSVPDAVIVAELTPDDWRNIRSALDVHARNGHPAATYIDTHQPTTIDTAAQWHDIRAALDFTAARFRKQEPAARAIGQYGMADTFGIQARDFAALLERVTVCPACGLDAARCPDAPDAGERFEPGSFWATEPIHRDGLTAAAEYDPFSPPAGGPAILASAMDHALTAARRAIFEGSDGREFEYAYSDAGENVAQGFAFMVRVTRDQEPRS